MKIVQVIFFVLALAFWHQPTIAQKIYDYRVKTASNSAERGKMLDIIRKKLRNDYSQEFVFSVRKLKISSGFAWFQGEVSRKDGKPVKVGLDDDCCHVEALLKQKGGNWMIVQMGAFSTDVWWEDLSNTTGAPQSIFLD
jgi:hypothetical protein